MGLIILDRDGVINKDSDKYIKSPEEWIPIPGSLEAIVRLNQAGYRVVIITNQSGIARGLFDISDLYRIHNKMYQLLTQMGGTIEAILFCPHLPEENCSCRKPKPGLFQDLSQRLRLQLVDLPAIGDSIRDIQAAQSAGAAPILVRTGKGSITENSKELPQGIPCYDDLSSAVSSLLATTP
ncbi:D-glycero-beta-D-manno-heptose 1,7-bisphosphate 7-phosphatase [Candidatus Nitrosacidococcus sp. I8]|uniref:D-glycero-beta-D-manno-heptose 1,7-bisphosphate 7-phosphatase n=1 Tax=Candidatus Nitrosacidococcus sp. I8 TaxID=2942908 RepID=UPI0022272DF1|nr:D-glycero-beta-D-manno-heptose 1,7-bisphosphate 7-phosphatase [Candidatus Nitrosacidococcus sp. I8]CAH9016931.1 D-glycero-beta-D-manno-heptose-1,7-bisphosphate 7-phosphatase [Candidatus Nitrosacidococcus sp. I8]